MLLRACRAARLRPPAPWPAIPSRPALPPLRPLSATTRALFPRTPSGPASTKPPLAFRDALGARPASPPLSLTDALAHAEPPHSFADAPDVRRPSIRNQVLFFAGGSLVAFWLAAQHTNTDTAYWARQLKAASAFSVFTEPTSDEMRRARYVALGKTLQTSLVSFRDATKDAVVLQPFLQLYFYAAKWYLELSDPKRVCYQLVAVNALVFLAWKIPALRTTMYRSWTHNPLSGRSYTMLTSTYSHKDFLHLFFNCYVLPSFGGVTLLWLAQQQYRDPAGRRESTPQWHFLAFFAAAGMFSSLVSHIYAIRVRLPRMLADLVAQPHLPTPAASAPPRAFLARIRPSSTPSPSPTPTSSLAATPAQIVPSLGASGAIYATVVIAALAFPQAEVALIFLPFVPLSISWGVGAMVLVDAVGLVRGWKMFDHAAHLGGALFGLAYYWAGPAFWNFMRALSPPFF